MALKPLRLPGGAYPVPGSVERAQPLSGVHLGGFYRFLSFSALQVMTERIRQFMEAQEAALREAYPRGRIPITVSFSDCRGQCTFSNLPDMATGRALAEQTGEFLTQLLDSSVEEEAASQTPGKKRT